MGWTMVDDINETDCGLKEMKRKCELEEMR